MAARGDTKPFDTTLNRMYNRDGLEQLPDHLNNTYGIDVAGVEALDVGVMRVDRRDGPTWVARVFSSLRPAKATAADAAVLRYLEQQDYPAERLAHNKPISTMCGQEVLVTKFIDSVKRSREPDVFEIRGRHLGRLHALPLPKGAAARPAGALHHFADGSRRDELDAVAGWLDQVEERVPAGDRSRLDQLRSALKEADDGAGLPVALIHPDPVGKNTIRTTDGFAYVDWTGAGIGPRIVSLEWLLGPGDSGARTIAGYAEHITLTDEECERLPGVIESRQLVNLCFPLALQPANTAKIVKRIPAIRREAKKVASAALAGLGR